MSTLRELMKNGPIVVNLGLRGFAESLKIQDRQVVHVDWTPPPPIDEEMENILDKLL